MRPGACQARNSSTERIVRSAGIIPAILPRTASGSGMWSMWSIISLNRSPTPAPATIEPSGATTTRYWRIGSPSECVGKRRGETAGRDDRDEVVAGVKGRDAGEDLLGVAVAQRPHDQPPFWRRRGGRPGDPQADRTHDLGRPAPCGRDRGFIARIDRGGHHSLAAEPLLGLRDAATRQGERQGPAGESRRGP